MTQMTNIKILSLNWHVPFLSLLAKIPQTEFLILSARWNGRDWEKKYRDIPSNISHIAIDSQNCLKNINLQDINLIILQSLGDIDYFGQLPQPKILVFHNSFQTETFGMSPEKAKQVYEQIKQKIQQYNIYPVFISKFKAESWQMAGTIIPPGIDNTDFPYCYNGLEQSVLRVCSNFRGRDFMNGFQISENIANQFNTITLGENNPQGRPNEKTGLANNFEEYKKILTSSRVFVSTNIDQYEDSYNLSSLEAGSIGMPIISYNHKNNIWVDGMTGYVSDNLGFLQQRITELMRDRELAVELGKKASQLVQANFPIGNFINHWVKVIQKVGGL